MNTMRMNRRSERLTRLGVLREPNLDPNTGAWRTPDPLGYVDGGDVYEYVKCSPVGGVDPMGLWDIQRKGQSRADALPASGDTIRTLAKEAHLDGSEYQKWLRVDGNSALGYEFSIDDDVSRHCYRFSVPNKVYATMGNVSPSWGENWIKFGIEFAPGSGTSELAWEALRTFAVDHRQYDVVENFNVTAAYIDSMLEDPDATGWYHVGHGSGKGGLQLNGGDLFIAQHISVLDHRWSFVYLCVCEAAHDYVLRNGVAGGKFDGDAAREIRRGEIRRGRS